MVIYPKVSYPLPPMEKLTATKLLSVLLGVSSDTANNIYINQVRTGRRAATSGVYRFVSPLLRQTAQTH